MTKADFLKMVEDWCDEQGDDLEVAAYRYGALRMAQWWAEQVRGIYKYNFKKGERSKILDLAEELLEEETKS